MYEVQDYVTRDGKDVFERWHGRVRDSSAKLAVRLRIVRAANGNFGDHKFCSDGVWELRIDIGAGYRVYYALEDDQVILLLCGGDKSSQASDIKRAMEFLKDWRDRADEK